MTKISITLILLFYPLVSHADLFDQRAASSVHEQVDRESQGEQYVRELERSNFYVLARSYGAQHGGAGQFSEQLGYGGRTKSLRFITGDNQACETYQLDYFECYDSANQLHKLWRDDYIKRDPRSGRYIPLKKRR